MRLSALALALLMMTGLSISGCGSNEATSVDSGELQSFVEENADVLAAEDAAEAAEEAMEDEEDDE